MSAVCYMQPNSNPETINTLYTNQIELKLKKDRKISLILPALTHYPGLYISASRRNFMDWEHFSHQEK